jgi:hypothetical protein
VADDWHHRISPKKIIALAMKRLEAHGKGILLLHDIHPATVAALPGLLKELKQQGSMSCMWCQPQSIIFSPVFMYLVKPPNP